MNRKLTEEQADALIDSFMAGVRPADLAVEFGISERHARRLTAGIVRRAEPLRVVSSAEEAVAAFLEGRALCPRER